jgi:hypothetical protein
MSAQINGNDAMLAGEVLGLRGEERAIARRSVDEDKGRAYLRRDPRRRAWCRRV